MSNYFDKKKQSMEVRAISTSADKRRMDRNASVPASPQIFGKQTVYQKRSIDSPMTLNSYTQASTNRKSIGGKDEIRDNKFSTI